MPKTQDIKVAKGGKNVFEDLGFKDAPELLAKAELSRQICNAVRERKLTHRAAGALLGLAHPDVTALMNGRTTNFSIDRLMKILTRLDNNVEIRISKKVSRKKPGRITVVAA